MLKTAAAAGLALGVALGAACARTSDAPPAEPARGDIDLPRETESFSGRVPRGSTFVTLLSSVGLRQDLIPPVVSLASRVFDPRHLKAEHAYLLERTFDGLVRRFEYEIDEDRYLRVLGLSDRQPEDLTVELVPYRKVVAQATTTGRITKASPSLFEAMAEAGEGPDLSIGLAGVFEGEIDFNSDLQVDDAFGVAFEKVYREGEFSSYGAVLAAEFWNDGRMLKAVRYAPPGAKPGYYDERGRSLKRLFLKSPLKFAAPVSSRFSRARMHPILRIVRPHLGVDYSAPSGSPVVAVSNGVVVSAGWSGDAGRLVHLRHPGGYETYYMHLSSIAVRAGQRVSQGDLVGKVGMTGLATGPHLDYRIKRNGAYMNPLLLHRSLPPGEPVPAASMAEFTRERDRLLALLAVAGANLDTPSPVR